MHACVRAWDELPACGKLALTRVCLHVRPSLTAFPHHRSQVSTEAATVGPLLTPPRSHEGGKPRSNILGCVWTEAVACASVYATTPMHDLRAA